jgi:hypothetical protein
MAAWQVELHLVPRRLVTTSAIAPSTLNGTEWWATVAFPSDYRARFGALAPSDQSPLPDHEAWGAEDKNRIDVWSSNGSVMKVLVRVDVRRLDSKFGAALLDFVKRAGAVLVRGDGLIVEPTIGAYAGALRSSNAWKFASDPAAFIASYRRDDDDA